MGQVETIEPSETSYKISYAVGVNTKPGDETALLMDNPNQQHKYDDTLFFILNGRWIDEYAACKSKEEQIQLFRDNYDQYAGFWTNSIEELDEALSKQRI